MTERDYAVLRGTKIVCQQCKALAAVPVTIFVDDLPAELTCPREGCGYVIKLHDKFMLPFFPKVDPTKTVKGQWQVSNPGYADPEAVHKSPLDAQVEQLDEGLRLASFREQMDELGGTILHGLRLGELIKQGIEKTVETMQQDLEKIYDDAHFFRRGIRPRWLGHFLRNPFLALPASSVDEAITPFLRWLMAPVFYQGIHGIPYTSMGGYYLQLITPYSRFNFPLESWMCERLELAPDLELEVLGNKLIGPALRYLWRDIPGLSLDDDHTEEMPSVRIHKQLEARTWLARHTVMPQSARPVPEEHIISTWDYLINDKQLFKLAWKAFKKHGRLLLLWHDREQAQDFALSAMAMLKPFKAFITTDSSRLISWKERLTAVAGNPLHQFLWHTYTELDLHHLENVEYIVVDYAAGIPLEYIERLYLYSGKIILLGDNPYMDILEDNREAATLYGLCGRDSIRFRDWWQDPPKRIQSQVTDHVHQALLELRK